MELTQELEKLLDEIGLEYVEMIAERRETLALRVKRDNKKMILKLHSNESNEESDRKQKLLEREALILSQIPHLTNHLYLGHGNSNGRYWLLVRDIEGQEVHQVAKQARESISDKGEKASFLIKLLIRVAKFYDVLFTGGYLHGDVQPAHTYLEQEEITVIDWGLARKIDEPNPLYKGGFVYFVAPEIAERMRVGSGTVAYTTSAEVYALGATLFLLYTGTLALDFGMPKADLRNAPMEQKLQRVIENRIHRMEDIGVEANPMLEALLRQSLSTDPKERFATPSLMHRRLLELAGS